MGDGDAGVRSTPPAPIAEVVRTPRSVSFAWLITLVVVASAIGFIAWQTRQAKGPMVQIVFDDAQGLEPGAPLVHLGTRVGVVRAVELTDDLARVRVRAELAPHAAGLAREGSKFWIVRPEVSLRGVSGIDALLGPRYVAVEPADASAARRNEFEGLTAAPAARAPDQDGLDLLLLGRGVGSVVAGSPVLYRGMPVGLVRSVELAGDATAVEVRVTIEPRYAALVRENSRFWDAGGVGVDFGLFRGLTVQAGSLDTVVQGAVGLATPKRPGERVGDGTSFELESEAKSDWLDWAPTIPIGE